MSYVAKHSKQRKTTKLVKLQWIASIWCQNGQKPQNYKRNQIRINLHRFEVKTIKNVELRRKSFKTTQNYESHQITMNCIDLMSKTSNQRKTTKVILFGWICIDLTSERSKQRKTTKVIKLQWIASIWCQNDLKNRKTTKAIKLLSICIDLTSKRSKMLSYVPKLQKQSNYYQCASIWRQNDQKCWVTSQNIQNNAKLRKSSNYNELHRFDVKNIKPTQNYKSDLISMNLHRFDVRTIKTTQNYESDQIIMQCIDLMSKRSKQRKTTILIKLLWIASIWCQNDQKSQNY